MGTTWRQISGRALVGVVAAGFVVGVAVDREYRVASPDGASVGESVLARDAEDRQPGTG
jgi:hypothetical protein